MRFKLENCLIELKQNYIFLKKLNFAKKIQIKDYTTKINSFEVFTKVRIKSNFQSLPDFLFFW